MTPHPGFDDVDLVALRRRRSEKWAAYDADVLPAWVAEMDFPLAPTVRDALAGAIANGDTGYANTRGLAEAYAGFAADRFGWALDPAWLWPVADVMTGVRGVLELVTEPGDAVVVNTPVYPPFFAVIEDTGRRVAAAPLLPADAGFALDFDAIEHAFAGGARAHLLCSPHNPTGRVYRHAELEALAGLAARYGVTVISDEIHAPMALAESIHVPFVTVPGAAEHGIVVASASKSWNVPGLKAAHLVAGSERIAGLLDTRLPKHLRYHVGHLGVIAAEAAFRDGRGWLSELTAYLDANRTLLGRLLAERLPGVRYVPPEAGYLAWLDCRELGLGDDPAAVFLERGRVALMSGLPFGDEGKGWARLNIGTSAALMDEAVRRMAGSPMS